MFKIINFKHFYTQNFKEKTPSFLTPDFQGSKLHPSAKPVAAASLWCLSPGDIGERSRAPRGGINLNPWLQRVSLFWLPREPLDFTPEERGARIQPVAATKSSAPISF